MTHHTLTTWTVAKSTTVRGTPRPRGSALIRFHPPRVFQGWECAPGWVEWVEKGEPRGYIRRDHLLAERTV